jgi:hypothetical protein
MIKITPISIHPMTDITRLTENPGKTDTGASDNINMSSGESSITRSCCDGAVQTACRSASTVCISSRTSRPPVNGSRLEKQRLMEFTRVLMKYLQTMNPVLYNEAQAVICDSFQRHMTEELLSVDFLKKRLREVTGDCYWLRAEQYYKRMLMMQQKELKIQKKEQKLVGGQDGRVAKQVHWGCCTSI